MKEDILKQIKEKSRLAAVEQVKRNNTNSMADKLSDIFGNKTRYLNIDGVFEPTFFQCTLKEAFYRNGGLATSTYEPKQYLKLFELDEPSFETLITEQPEFLLWVHDKRSITDEIDMLVTVASRRLINSMRSADVDEQAKALNTLSKFSSVVNPKKSEDDLDKDIENLTTPEQVKQMLKELGNDYLDDSEELSQSIKILGEDE